jgi:hypothetical protein
MPRSANPGPVPVSLIGLVGIGSGLDDGEADGQ